MTLFVRRTLRMHRCPGCRNADVSDAMLACLPCWRQLPEPVRAEVLATRRLPMAEPRRREALLAAVNEWARIRLDSELSRLLP